VRSTTKNTPHWSGTRRLTILSLWQMHDKLVTRLSGTDAYGVRMQKRSVISSGASITVKRETVSSATKALELVRGI
jgi:hypothetical protein